LGVAVQRQVGQPGVFADADAVLAAGGAPTTATRASPWPPATSLLHEGPGITAAAQGQTVWTGALDGEERWPRFGPRVVGLGVHSALGVPLTVSGRVVGVLTVYAHGTDAFDAHAADLTERFAAPAAVTVHNARVLARAQRLTTQLETALTGRAIIDQAVGILRSRSGGTAAETLARLQAISQAENQRLSAVARHVVDEAARRARARHIDP